MTELTIRETLESDLKQIIDLHLNAFGEGEGSDVSQLAVDLHADTSAKPIISLVAEDAGVIVGNIIFSSVDIKEENVQTSSVKGGYILCPLAVSSDHQKGGIGSQLIKTAFALLKARGGKYIFVLGDPKYYSKFGFKLCNAINPPYPLPYPEAWQVHELHEGALVGIKGLLECADCLNSPELW